MFQAVKGFKKEDLKCVAAEIGEEMLLNITIVGLKDIILNSNEFKKIPEFVQEFIRNMLERKLQEAEKDKQKERELEVSKLEAEKEIELARIQFQNRGESFSSNSTADLNNSKRKFTLPRLELRQFSDNSKVWLPFWSQFEQIHKDEDITPEDKFQYLVQATVTGSHARQIVEMLTVSIGAPDLL
ncbi:integrase catalytic domain-containing protein [Trichonephila clavipes]|nr:integrase catalytic domain-containing protein [Trichonephila clavipes]